MKLSDIKHELPLLVILVNQRLKAGDQVWVKAHLYWTAEHKKFQEGRLTKPIYWSENPPTGDDDWLMIELDHVTRGFATAYYRASMIDNNLTLHREKPGLFVVTDI